VIAAAACTGKRQAISWRRLVRPVRLADQGDRPVGRGWTVVCCRRLTCERALPIATKRLIIRPFTPADFEAIHPVWSDPAVMAPIPSPPFDREQSWARLTGKLRHQARHGFSK